MATITTNFTFKPLSSTSPNPNLFPLNPHRSSFPFLTSNPSPSTISLSTSPSHRLIPKATAASGEKKTKSNERIQRVHTVEEFDLALQNAKEKLVVVEFAASDDSESYTIYPFMVDLSRTCNDVEFLLVMSDESEKTKEICSREKVENVPHFNFYKSMEKIHEEEGIGPDQLVGDVLYYGDNHSGVVQLHSGEDVEKLIEDHKVDSNFRMVWGRNRTKQRETEQNRTNPNILILENNILII